VRTSCLYILCQRWGVVPAIVGGSSHGAYALYRCERNVFWSEVHVAETSCLGLCSADGTAIAIQPRNRWYSDVRPGDVPALLEAEFGADASRLGIGRGDDDRQVG
jgi:(2Fe-2S) ferredoxin